MMQWSQLRVGHPLAAVDNVGVASGSSRRPFAISLGLLLQPRQTHSQSPQLLLPSAYIFPIPQLATSRLSHHGSHPLQDMLYDCCPQKNTLVSQIHNMEARQLHQLHSCEELERGRVQMSGQTLPNCGPYHDEYYS
uniref:Uncharacterized protein n=1 Tax=Arundo donax TaxID=35708 RepID=A0A0A9DWW2_ARUDO